MISVHGDMSCSLTTLKVCYPNILIGEMGNSRKQ